MYPEESFFKILTAQNQCIAIPARSSREGNRIKKSLWKRNCFHEFMTFWIIDHLSLQILNWKHGRVLYTRKYQSKSGMLPVRLLGLFNTWSKLLQHDWLVRLYYTHEKLNKINPNILDLCHRCRGDEGTFFRCARSWKLEEKLYQPK